MSARTPLHELGRGLVILPNPRRPVVAHDPITGIRFLTVGEWVSWLDDWAVTVEAVDAIETQLLFEPECSASIQVAGVTFSVADRDTWFEQLDSALASRQLRLEALFGVALVFDPPRLESADLAVLKAFIECSNGIAKIWQGDRLTLVRPRADEALTLLADGEPVAHKDDGLYLICPASPGTEGLMRVTLSALAVQAHLDSVWPEQATTGELPV